MASIRNLQRSFSAGEITPELYGRVDLAKRQEGLAKCRNFITLPHGPAVNRPGTEFVAAVKDSTKATRVIPFSYNNTQVFAIEIGEGYFRWHTDAATLLYSTPAAYNGATAYTVGNMCSNGGVNYYCIASTTGNAPPNAAYWYAMPTNPNIYEIPNEYTAAEVMDIHYVQSADVLTLVHPNHRPKELRRYGATDWRVSTPVFAPPASPISTISSSASGAGAINYSYVVTAVKTDRLEETVASASTTVANDLTVSGHTNTVTWTDNGSAGSVSRYYVYKLSNGLYGYIGQAVGTTFVDDNITADVSRTPPIADPAAAFVPPGIASITITNPGAGYTPGSYFAVFASDPEGTGFVGMAHINGAGKVDTVAVLDTGYGYTSPTFSMLAIGPGAGATFAVGSYAASNYPSAVGYFQQRRMFAGTTAYPQNVWATKSGTESNMSYNIPVQSDDRIAIRIAAREASAIRHIVPAKQLLLFSATCEWACSADANGGVLTPSSISVVPQSYIGSSNVVPVVVNNIVLYAAARGGHIRELSYTWQASGYTSGDISLMAPHLFDYNTIVDMAYARGPVPILWAVSSNGRLLGMTYVPEQQVSAWHWHDTEASGAFESCCTITENNEDMLYLVVRRTINGATVRYIERMHTRQFDTLADAFFVDCGATYNGTPTTSVSGLTWLEGQTVNILGDGAVFPAQTVTGGAITLDQPCSKITVGLPITSQMQTLPAAMQIDGGLGQGRQKNVNRAWLRVYRSSGILAGPDFNNLLPYKQRTTEPCGSPPDLVSNEIEIVLWPTWSAGGQICIEQTDPLPLDVTSLTLEIAMGA